MQTAAVVGNHEAPSPDSFKDYPVSLAEMRPGDSSKWTPRDALIKALRDLDSGEIECDSLVIIARTKGSDGSAFPKYYAAMPDVIQALGLVELWKLQLVFDQQVD